MASPRIERLKVKKPVPPEVGPSAQQVTVTVPAKPLLAASTDPANQPPVAVKPKRQPADMLKFVCGHERAVERIIAQPCIMCQEKVKHDIIEARKARQQAKREAGREPDKYPADPCRLPDGACKVLTWNVTTGMWHGTLRVPGIPQVFAFAASGEKRTFHGLHDEMQKYLARQQSETTAP